MPSKTYIPPRFYPILDTSVVTQHGLQTEPVAAAILEAGAKILQYRHKDAWTQAHYDEAERIAKLCAQAATLFVLNDRADYAKLIGAALHIGQDDLPVPAAREIVGDAVLGFSTHNRAQLLRGNEENVDYLSIGPIFSTTSKQKPDPVVGIEGIKKLRPLTQKPVVAIGGITLENAGETLAAGADSVAVISGVLTGSKIKENARRWMEITSASD